VSSTYQLIATSTFGLEAVVSRELKQLGFEDLKVEDGRVYFQGDESAICKANLWLRSANRVLVEVGTFQAVDFGELFDQTEAIDWSEWIQKDSAFPVRGKSVRSQLHSVPHCQSIVKKAIVSQLGKKYQTEWLEETGAEYPIEVAIRKDQVSLTIDTSGDSLHKRGYRKLAGPSPIKETLAAGLIQLSYWNRERVLIDPFCGSGTIPVEAALIGRNIAPGKFRSFQSENWSQIPANLWKEAREEATSLELPNLEEPIIGTDLDDSVLSLARYHAEQAGVADEIHFQQKAFSEFTTKRHYGCLICNPPYGERSGELEAAESIYENMGRIFPDLETWSIYVLTSYKQFESLCHRKADRRRKLYNGRIECTYYQYYGPRPPRRKNNEAQAEDVPTTDDPAS
jgi:putative N6-adenine-specific DNA methylase